MSGYQGEVSGSIYTTPDGNPYKWLLSKDQIELIVQTTDGENFTSWFKFIWAGTYKISNGTLTLSAQNKTDTVALDYREDVLNYPSHSHSHGYALRFTTPANGSLPAPLKSQTNEVIYAYDTSEGQILPSAIGAAPVSATREVALQGHTWSNKIQEGWWNSAFDASGEQISASEANILLSPQSFGKQTADIITNYNPKSDSPIQIELSSFDGALGKLKIAKKAKQVEKLAKKNTDFIYDQQAGYLYYNENGKQAGFGDGGIFAILEGKPKVGTGNFEFM